MNTLASLLRDNIRQLTPYSSARKEYSGTSQILLDANEAPCAFPGFPEDIYRYPDPLQLELKKEIASWRNVKTSQIFLGNGSDEAIDLLIRCFCNPGKDKIIIMPPTYGMYKVSADINQVEVLSVNLLPDFNLNTQELMGCFSDEAKIMFICHPNNPTGNCQSPAQIKTLLDTFPGIVVIDEAYIDFAPEKSLISLIDEYPRLVVLQTFSKAWGLAGARVGMAFANEELIAVLNAVKYPYNLNTLSARMALQLIKKQSWFYEQTKMIINERQKFAERLKTLPLVENVFPSDANFILVETSDYQSIYEYLKQYGIIVRVRNQEPLCQNCLRISIGSPIQMTNLISAWERFPAPFQEPEKAVPARTATYSRATAETSIFAEIKLDGKGRATINTGMGFFNHMLEQIARHSGFDISLLMQGDLWVDEHHSIEDAGIALGTAFSKALGNKSGIQRYGFSLPMDESDASVLIDLSGRINFKWKVKFKREKIGEMPTEMLRHFFESFAQSAACNLHIKAKGKNEHHKAEAVFKAFARALRQATQTDGSDILPTTKELL